MFYHELDQRLCHGLAEKYYYKCCKPLSHTHFIQVLFFFCCSVTSCMDQWKIASAETSRQAEKSTIFSLWDHPYQCIIYVEKDVTIASVVTQPSQEVVTFLTGCDQSCILDLNWSDRSISPKQQNARNLWCCQSVFNPSTKLTPLSICVHRRCD